MPGTQSGHADSQSAARRWPAQRFPKQSRNWKSSAIESSGKNNLPRQWRVYRVYLPANKPASARIGNYYGRSVSCTPLPRPSSKHCTKPASPTFSPISAATTPHSSKAWPPRAPTVNPCRASSRARMRWSPLSAAHGYAQATGRAQAVIVHVECGTRALAGAIHNAAKGRVPVLIFAGTSPFTQEGELRGSRNEFIHWLQGCKRPARHRPPVHAVRQRNPYRRKREATGLSRDAVRQKRSSGPRLPYGRTRDPRAGSPTDNREPRLLARTAAFPRPGAVDRRPWPRASRTPGAPWL